MTIYVQLILTALIWGGTFIAGRLVSESVHPFSAGFMRFAIASLCLLIMAYQSKEHFPKLRLHQLWLIILLGLSGVFAYNVCFFLGLKTISVGRAALIVALNPVAIAIASAFIFQDKLSSLKLLGIATSLVGAAIVIGKGNPFNLLVGGVQQGDLFILGCVISWVTYTLIGKQVLGTLSPLITTTYACIFGAIALFPFAIHNGLIQDFRQLSAIAGASIIYLGFFGSALAFNWYYTGVQAIGAARAAIFINLVPISAVILASFLLKEPITSSIAIGGGLVVTGVFCTNRS
jgi:drug/metabolite transporter (DMT)-like permease